MELEELRRLAGITEEQLDENQYAQSAADFDSTIKSYLESIARKIERGDSQRAENMMRDLRKWLGGAVLAAEAVEAAHDAYIRKQDSQRAVAAIQHALRGF